MVVEVHGVELITLWWLGAIIYVIGSIGVNCGSNLIRKDHSDKLLHNPPKPIHKRPFLFAGWSLFIGGNILNFSAFMFAAQSMLAALGSVQFVTNLGFARLINKEPITQRAVIATAIIIAGNILIVIFGSKTTRNHTLDELKGLFFDDLFLGYLVCITVIVIVTQGLYWYFQKKIRELPADQKIPSFIERYQPFAYAIVSALIGTNSIILAKVVSGLIHNAILGVPVFTNIGTYVVLAFFIACTVFWLYRLNHALKLYDAMFIIPTLQCVWLLFGVIGGGIFFQEFVGFSTTQAIFFSAGVIVLVLGILVLKPSNKIIVETEGELPPQQVEVELSEMGDTPTPDGTSNDETPRLETPDEDTVEVEITLPDDKEGDINETQAVPSAFQEHDKNETESLGNA